MMNLVGKHIRTTLQVIIFMAASSPSTSPNFVLSGSPLSSFTGAVTSVSTIVGGEVDLPCDTKPPKNNDSLLLVVWYRDDNPVYSYDTRLPGSTGHWTGDELGNRARWLDIPSSTLHIQDVQIRDRATYRCRVDFQVSPTRNYRVALEVIELPNKPVILDEYGKEIARIAGPYNEGEDIKLICSVTGGNPPPSIQWLHGNNVLESLKAELTSNEVWSLNLTIRNVSKEQLNAEYTCQASNTLLAMPRSAMVKIELYLRPLTVEVSDEQPLSAGRKAEFVCKSMGSRPPANISWWLGSLKLHSADIKEKVNDNETTSILHWIPLREHNKKILTCKVEHSMFANFSIAKSLPLTVFYVPRVNIHFGSKINPNDIEEGDDVYFRCAVDANPPAYKIIWEHNGITLQHNTNNGVLITGNTNLAVRNVSRYNAGKYTCTASNVEGDGRSFPLNLQIMYKPICRKRHLETVAATVKQQTRVLCEVNAHPPPETFEWILNNSAGSITIDPQNYTVETDESRSTLFLILTNEIDYGTLYCRATNLAGQQATPCVFTLLPATQPEMPTNCTVENITDDSLYLHCLPGYDGGIPSNYTVEVWESGKLIVNSTKMKPVWNLQNLGSKKLLRLLIYAANSKGKSQNIVLKIETHLRLTPRPEAQEAWDVTWAMSGAIGGAIFISSILCFLLISLKFRKRFSYKGVTLPLNKENKDATKIQNPSQASEDPDLIPLNKGLTECTPDPPQYSLVIVNPEKSMASTINIENIQPANTSTTRLPQNHSTRVEGTYCFSNNKDTIRPNQDIVTKKTQVNITSQQESCV